MTKRHWPDLNDLARIAAGVWAVIYFWRKDKREGGWNPPAKVLPFKGEPLTCVKRGCADMALPTSIYCAGHLPPAMVHNGPGTILKQAEKQVGELAAKVTTDGERVDGEVSVTAQGQSWAAKLWAKVIAREQAKPDVSAGVEISKRWFGGW
jgi:hypothetical protein